MGAPRRLTGILAGTLAAPLLLSLLLSVLVTVLSGCGGGDSVADPPVSSPPTSSPTGTPHRESPEHFIRRFYVAERAMENSGETGPYQALWEGCRSCASLARQVSRFYSHGGFVRWGGLTIDSIRPYGSDSGGRTYAVKGNAKPTTFKESSSANATHLSGGPTTELVTLAKAADSWRVVGFAKLGSS